MSVHFYFFPIIPNVMNKCIILVNSKLLTDFLLKYNIRILRENSLRFLYERGWRPKKEKKKQRDLWKKTRKLSMRKLWKNSRVNAHVHPIR